MRWSQKYKPEKLSEIPQETELLKNTISQKKPIIIYGPTGSGKTAAIYAFASQLDYEILELNASDLRNKEQLLSIVGSASQQQSLFKKGKIILIDEIDAIAGREDYGAIPTLISLTQKTNFPIIFTANNPYEKKLAPLRRKAILIEFQIPDYLEIFKILKNICKKEKIKANDEDLKTLARRTQDIRAAIDDLQNLTEQKKRLKKQDLETLGERRRAQTIFSALKLIFKSKKPELVLPSLENTDLDINDALLWIDENLPYQYKNPEDLAKAYEILSKIDVFNGRIKKSQYYRFLTHINTLTTLGIALSKKEKYSEFIPYKRPERILKLYIAKQRYAKRLSIAQKVSKLTHTSIKKSIKDTIPYLKFIIKNNNELINQLELEQDEVEWLKK